METEKMEIRQIPTDDIQRGQRFRKEFGDITALTTSIDELGLLQPIGVTADNDLVFGERWLMAMRQLGWNLIPSRVVNLERAILGEYAENEFRKAFTISEKESILAAIKNPRGGDRTKEQSDNCRPLDKETAAKAAGFKNAKEAERATQVVDAGVPELVEAMDEGTASVSAAAEVARLPKDEQRAAVAGGKKEIIKKAKEVREKRKNVHENIPGEEGRVHRFKCYCKTTVNNVLTELRPIIHGGPDAVESLVYLRDWVDNQIEELSK